MSCLAQVDLLGVQLIHFIGVQLIHFITRLDFVIMGNINLQGLVDKRTDV